MRDSCGVKITFDAVNYHFIEFSRYPKCTKQSKYLHCVKAWYSSVRARVVQSVSLLGDGLGGSGCNFLQGEEIY